MTEVKAAVPRVTHERIRILTNGDPDIPPFARDPTPEEVSDQLAPPNGAGEDAHKTELNGPDLGTLMLERDSYERVVEGLKRSADGARHLVHWQQHGSWDAYADRMDKIRVAVVRLAGIERPGDADPTRVFRGLSSLTRIDAYMRIHEGLTGAAAGARQLATCHRMDLRWSVYAAQLEKMRDSSSEMVRLQKAQRAGLILPN